MRAKRSRVAKEAGVRKTVAAKRVKRAAVLKMLAETDPGATSAASGAAASGAAGAGDAVADFLTTGRTGRRNAMPDILGVHAATSVGDLPDCLGKLNTAGSEATTPVAGGGGGVTPSNPFGPSTSRAADPAPRSPSASASTSAGADVGHTGASAKS